MTSDCLLTSTVDSVTTITLNRPQVLNAWDMAMRAELISAMTEAGREFLAEALTNMGCTDRIGEIISVPDLIDFDEGRIE